MRQVREVNTHSGWRSQGDLARHFGLGAATQIESLKVHWPSGLVQQIDVDQVNSNQIIVEAR